MGRSILELKDDNPSGITGPDAETNECNIIIGRTIIVPAGGEAVAQGFCVNNETVFTGMLEATSRFRQKRCMMVACAVVKTGVWGVPVRVFNAGDQLVTIYKNTMAATCREVEVMTDKGYDGSLEEAEVGVNCRNIYGHYMRKAVLI
jgi:hypothetical protein